MHEKASASNLIDALQASQVVGGVKTWVAKWSIVTRVPWAESYPCRFGGFCFLSALAVSRARSAALKSNEEFGFVMALFVKAGSELFRV